MPEDLVFTVQPGVARRAQSISLAEAGLRERADLQEWVRKSPEILGSGIRIVTFEFGAWQARDGHASDRLDLLGLDDDGRLVVAELKRGPASDTVEMQAIKYAAFASRFTSRSIGGFGIWDMPCGSMHGSGRTRHRRGGERALHPQVARARTDPLGSARSCRTCSCRRSGSRAGAADQTALTEKKQHPVRSRPWRLTARMVPSPSAHRGGL